MNAKKKLLKDIALAVGGFGVMYLLCCMGSGPSTGDLFGCFMGCGVLFGWQLASKIITAVSIYGIAIKLALSFLLGIPAMPIILIVDIIRLVLENREAKKQEAVQG